MGANEHLLSLTHVRTSILHTHLRRCAYKYRHAYTHLHIYTCMHAHTPTCTAEPELLGFISRLQIYTLEKLVAAVLEVMMSDETKELRLTSITVLSIFISKFNIMRMSHMDHLIEIFRVLSKHLNVVLSDTEPVILLHKHYFLSPPTLLEKDQSVSVSEEEDKKETPEGNKANIDSTGSTVTTSPITTTTTTTTTVITSTSTSTSSTTIPASAPSAAADDSDASSGRGEKKEGDTAASSSPSTASQPSPVLYSAAIDPKALEAARAHACTASVITATPMRKKRGKGQGKGKGRDKAKGKGRGEGKGKGKFKGISADYGTAGDSGEKSLRSVIATTTTTVNDEGEVVTSTIYTLRDSESDNNRSNDEKDGAGHLNSNINSTHTHYSTNDDGSTSARPATQVVVYDVDEQEKVSLLNLLAMLMECRVRHITSNYDMILVLLMEGLKRPQTLKVQMIILQLMWDKFGMFAVCRVCAYMYICICTYLFKGLTVFSYV